MRCNVRKACVTGKYRISIIKIHTQTYMYILIYVYMGNHNLTIGSHKQVYIASIVDVLWPCEWFLSLLPSRKEPVEAEIRSDRRCSKNSGKKLLLKWQWNTCRWWGRGKYIYNKISNWRIIDNTTLTLCLMCLHLPVQGSWRQTT